ncbi:FecR domain-containing protein [Galbibacter sp. BG1]|uniref:FecR family protein n=1 Tax=Galbibacter sp. BG1 TaxID=1170699 RepID=UPI0015BF4FF7|nr:FecR domain-containing protein [Galbibacter sp. BG1]QLE01265.1 FecR domain-containing protein [Galbibacter sp. BG1]
MSRNQDFDDLLDRYYNDKCTSEEKKIIDDYFQNLQEDGISPEDVKHNLGLKNRIYKNINKNIAEKRTTTFKFFRVAAAIAMLIGISTLAYFVFQNSTETKYLTAKAAYGDQLKLVLGDSSVVFLNSGSALSYPQNFENEGSREVTLEGEAFFQITKNPNKPFIVSTENIKTRVLGTSFNVNTFNPDQPQVVVSTGKVRVSNTANESMNVDLLPNEKAVLDLKSNQFTKSLVAAKDYEAWRNGEVVFNESNLQDVALILERRFDIKVNITSPVNTTCTINGKYSGEDLEGLLESISFIHEINYQFKDGVLKLSGKACESN